jgi:hypothetical protein
MFEYWRLQRKLSRLERAYRKDEEGTRAAVEAARLRGASSRDIEEITGGSDAPVIQRRIHEALSNYLIAKAHRLVIPLPDRSEDNLWSVNSDTGEAVLTRQGINELRSVIRSEEKARREAILMWVPAITAVTGLLGALIGVIATWFGIKFWEK